MKALPEPSSQDLADHRRVEDVIEAFEEIHSQIEMSPVSRFLGLYWDLLAHLGREVPFPTGLGPVAGHEELKRRRREIAFRAIPPLAGALRVTEYLDRQGVGK